MKLKNFRVRPKRPFIRHEVGRVHQAAAIVKRAVTTAVNAIEHRAGR